MLGFLLLQLPGQVLNSTAGDSSDLRGDRVVLPCFPDSDFGTFSEPLVLLVLGPGSSFSFIVLLLGKEEGDGCSTSTVRSLFSFSFSFRLFFFPFCLFCAFLWVSLLQNPQMNSVRGINTTAHRLELSGHIVHVF